LDTGVMLDSASRGQDVAPATRILLGHDRSGQHSIRVNDRYRLCFVWENGDAYQAEIVDYH
jgi:proteic killer suppression protein